MDQERINKIEYDEGWQEVTAEQLYPAADSYIAGEEDIDNTEEAEAAGIRSKKRSDTGQRQTLLYIQIVLCLTVALAAFVLKSIGGDIYKISRQWYYREYNASLIVTDYFNIFDLSKEKPEDGTNGK